jgi:DNA replicative helicase MCM subunit Mcm2 (Cdc46/Mcm family)
VIATANPKGDRFTATTLDKLKEQLPFDSALLTRFHLIFLIRKPGVKEFVDISRKILKNEKSAVSSSDENFIKAYVRYAAAIEVRVPKDLEEDIIAFLEEKKQNEDQYLFEISPRTVLGFMRLVKASARMRLSKEATKDDLDCVKALIEEGLKF